MSRVTLVHVLVLLKFAYVKCSNEAIDSSFLENVLDAEECHRQMRTIRRNFTLGMQFTDAGIRTPRGVLSGNTADLGNYHQCLAIEEQREDMYIQGKYCSINVPMEQTFRLPRPTDQQEMSSFNPSSLNLDEEHINKVKECNTYRRQLNALIDFRIEENQLEKSIFNTSFSELAFTLGVCVPKPCTTQQAITSLLFNVSAIGFNYTDNYCRLKGDKPWSGGDTAAVVIFSIIGFVTLLSTTYDLCYRFVFKKDMKKVNPVYSSCSLYTNSQRLMTFNYGPGTLTCMDGIRAISMTWVILGHTFGSESVVANILDAFIWMGKVESLWVTLGFVAVDTFFAMSGILVVYTTARKMNGTKLLKNLHWFYLSRIVRIMPLLAVTILLQISYLNHMADGPAWGMVEDQTNRCRNNWWQTLLFIQNLYNPSEMCTAHSWYIAIDLQLYVLSPLVLFWVLGKKKRKAWLALTIALLAVLVASTIYCFNLNLPAGQIAPTRSRDEVMDFMLKYYFHTLGRASPFFVGLIFGYILHIYRDQKVHMSWALVCLIWVFAGAVSAYIGFFNHQIKQLDWDNQFMDNFMNSFMRPAWAIVVGLVIFLCVHGYGGPVNWFLSLHIWRLPARLSYAMYLVHYPLMFTINGTMVVPVFFSVGLFTFKFLAYLTLSVVLAFFFTVLIDSPISTLFNLLMTKEQRKNETPKENNTITKVDDKDEVINEESKTNEPVVNNNCVPAIAIK